MRFLLALAIIPAVLLLARVYTMDRIEKENTRLLVKLLILGAVATIPAVIWEQAGDRLMRSFWPGRQGYAFRALYYFGVVALAEECCKYYFLKRTTWSRPDFNCSFDGIVYAVFTSLGFAVLENIEYVFIYGAGTALLRAVTAVPGHACFGVLMGAQYSLARQAENRGRPGEASRRRALAICLPVLIHGAYDLIATITSSLFSPLFLGILLVVWLVNIKLVKRCSLEDHDISNPYHSYYRSVSGVRTDGKYN